MQLYRDFCHIPDSGEIQKLPSDSGSFTREQIILGLPQTGRLLSAAGAVYFIIVFCGSAAGIGLPGPGSRAEQLSPVFAFRLQGMILQVVILI